MQHKSRWIVAGATALVVVAVGAGVGAASSGGTGDSDQPLSGQSLDKAVAAALEATGGGSVIETEVGDDGAAYGVEIKLEDGSVVEVNLDQDFQVIGQAADNDGAGDKDGANDG